jgi:hypothetical protein
MAVLGAYLLEGEHHHTAEAHNYSESPQERHPFRSLLEKQATRR